MRRTVILGLLVALFATGCYTMLRHPQVQEAETRDVGSARCIACHNDWELEAMEYGFHHRLYGYYGYGRWWDQYYLEPWWYGDSGTSPPVRGGQRRRQGEAIEVPTPAPRRGTVPGRAQSRPKPPKTRAGERQAQEVESPSTPSGSPGSDESSPPKDTTPKRKTQGKSIETPPPRPRP